MNCFQSVRAAKWSVSHLHKDQIHFCKTFVKCSSNFKELDNKMKLKRNKFLLYLSKVFTQIKFWHFEYRILNCLFLLQSASDWQTFSCWTSIYVSCSTICSFSGLFLSWWSLYRRFFQIWTSKKYFKSCKFIWCQNRK